MQPKQGSDKVDCQDDEKLGKRPSFIPDDGWQVSTIKVIYQNEPQLALFTRIQENIRNELQLLSISQGDVQLLQKLDMSCKQIIAFYNQLKSQEDDITQLMLLTKAEIVLFFDLCEQIEQEGRLFQNNLKIFFANIIELKQDLHYGSYIQTQPGSILQSDQLPKSQLILTQSQQELAFEQNEYSLLQLELNSKIIAKLSKLERNNQLIDPTSYQISEPINCQSKEVLFYVLREQFLKAGQDFKQSLQPDELLLYSFQAMYSLAWDSRKHYRLRLDEQETHYTYEKISTNKNLRRMFISDVKNALAQAFDVEQTSVTINLIEKGSIIVHFSILNPDFDGVPDPQLLKKLFGNVNPKVEKSLLFQRASLSINDLDPRFDMSWEDHEPGEFDIRGPDDHNGMKYYFPVGWYGHALKVLDKYGSDNCWLSMDGNPKEWCVLYHGTRFDRTTARGILDEGLRPGGGQNYESEICLKTKKRVGRGVYFSNHIEVCQTYCEPTIIGDYQFHLVFQARVNPPAIRQIQKDPDLVYTDRQMTTSFISYDQMTVDNSTIPNRQSIENPYANDYFVVNVDEGIPRNQSDIRPYRILLRQEKNGW